MKIAKKIIALMLALLMILTVFPLSAFAEEKTKTSISTDNIEYIANNAVGDVLLNELNNTENETDKEYHIASVTIDGVSATADVTFANDCTLIIALYNEDGTEILHSAKQGIYIENYITSHEEINSTSFNEEISVYFDTDTMPDYYLIKVFLVNSDNEPLCKSYVNEEHTKKFEEFMVTTTEDFEEEQVINIDESTDNNFLVVADNSVIAEKSEYKNEVKKDDYQNGEYIIENADDTVKNLKKGDIFFYPYGDGGDEYIITKVGDIDKSGDTVTISADTSATPDDLFEFAKVHIETGSSTFDFADMDDEIVHEEVAQQPYSVRSTSGSESVSVKHSYTWNAYKLKISDRASVTISGNFILSASLEFKFYKDNKSNIDVVELYIKHSAEINVNISGKVSVKIPLGQLGFDAVVVTAKLTPKFVIELTVAEFEATISTVEGRIGFSYDQNNGFKSINESPEVSYDPELKASASIFIGVELSLDANALYVIELKPTIRIGLKISAEQKASLSTSEIHECSGICLDGSVNLEVSAKFKLKLFFIDATPLDLSLKINIGKFYYSKSQGLHAGICPNKKYLFIFSVKDKNGEFASGVTVSDKNNPDNKAVTDSEGNVSLYFHGGDSYAVFTDSVGNKYTKKISATKSKTVNIRLNFVPGVSGAGSGDSSDEEPEIPEIPDNLKYYGSCGDNLTWQLYDNGILVISGTGDMYDYNSYNMPWYDYLDDIVNIIIEDGVTSIGSDAFRYCSAKSITIGSDVTHIWHGSFNYCYALTSITIPASVEYIGFWNFLDCDALQEIIVEPENKNYYSDKYGVLYNKNKTELLYYPDNNPVTEYVIPDTVKEISINAFDHVKNLKELTIGKNVDSLIDEDYYDSSNSDTILNGIDNLEKIYVHKDNKYYSNDSNGILYNKNKTDLMYFPKKNNLEVFKIPETVTIIYAYAFYFCDLKKLQLPDSMTTFNTRSVSSSYIESIKFGANISAIDGTLSTYGLKEIIVPSSNQYFSSNSEGHLFNKNKTTLVRYIRSDQTDYQIPDGVITIGDGAFYNCDSLTSITIPDSVTTIGDGAFKDCDSLTNITIPDSVTTIGDDAFYNCDSLTSITIPDSITTIGDSTFQFCNSLTDIIIPDSVTTIGDSAFYSCDSLASIEIPDSVTTIGDSAFDGCNNLVSITIPDSVTTIGDSAFDGCNNLVSITIPDSVTTIGNYAFSSCDSLASVTIGGSVTTIGEYAFSSCYNLADITIADAFVMIAYNAFDDTAYYNNPDNWENDVLYINNHLLKSNNATNSTYYIKQGTISIASSAFAGYWELKEVIIPDSVKVIGDNAFDNCINLQNVLLGNNIKIIGNEAFYNCQRLKSIIIPDSVTELGERAFSDCYNLQNVVLSKNISVIKQETFYFCASLTEIVIPDNVTVIGALAFGFCGLLEKVTLSENLKELHEGAFASCAMLKEIKIPDSVENGNNEDYYSDYAFSQCIFLEKIEAPATYIAANPSAFAGSGMNLNEVYIKGNSSSFADKSIGFSTYGFVGDLSEFKAIYKEIIQLQYSGWLDLKTEEEFIELEKRLIELKKELDSRFFEFDEPRIISNVKFYGQKNSSTEEYANKFRFEFIDYYPPTSFASIAPVNYLSNAPLQTDAVLLTDNLKTETVNNAIIGNEYIIYVVKDENANDLTSPDNLLYIDQKTAESETVTFEYSINESIDDYKIIVKNRSVETDSTSHEHEYQETVVQSTCTEQGYTIHYCPCGELYYDNYIQITGHTPEVIPGKPATETEIGLTDGEKCSVCGTVTKEQTEIPVLSHTHNYTTTVTAPTCTDKGFTTYTCECGDTYNDNFVDAKGHTEETISGKTATCTETGLTEGKKCSVCGETLVAQEEISALGHDYVAVVTAPSCIDKGYTTYTCSCGDSYVDNYVEATGHTELVIAGKSATCTETGLTEGMKCSVCGETLVAQEEISALGHDYVAVVTAPSCIDKGYTTYTCSCGDSYVDNYVEATGHTEEVIASKSATCTEAGLTEGKKCSVCGEILVAQEEIPALGHKEEVISRKSATCTETGLTEGKKCSVCGEILVAQSEISALGHKEEIISGKSATCTETGLTEGKKCSVCNEILVAQSEIPALDHNYVAVVTAPSCIDKGYTTYTCSCGDSYVDNYVEATGHTEEAIAGKAAICTETGLTEGKKCSVCGEVLVAQKEIPATGHTPGSWEVVVEAQVGEDGLEQQKCTVCGEVLDERVIPALPDVSYMTGDANGDGKITAADARIALRISAKVDSLEKYNLTVAALDVTGDGKLTAADARKILRIAAKIE